jgi:uncharacterized surface protein with fasciclin (FAS1) repeats
MDATHSKRQNHSRPLAASRWVRTALAVAVSAFGIGLTTGTLSADVITPIAQSGAAVPIGAATGSSADDNLLEAARAEGGLSAFLALVDAAELGRLLESDGPLTVFAPHNAAFATDRLLGRQDREDVRRLVLRHVVRGKYNLGDLAERDHVNSIAEDRSFTALSVERVGERIVIGGEAWIVGESIETRNGVIHVISRVLS